jgi:ribosomal protein S18 acetylase RimI-like enzyme
VAATEVVVEVALVGEEQAGHALATIRTASTVASMTGHRLLPGADPRLRVVPWRGDPRTAHVTPTRGQPTTTSVQRLVEDLTASGVATVLTGALPATEQQAFLEAGFEEHERLHLLVRTLDHLPEAPPAALRRGHPSDRPEVLDVDGAAFPPFWRLDEPGLSDALAATPSTRFRVAVDRTGSGAVVGYAVTGRAGPRGYLQRLAVRPAQQRAGLGAALVVDGLRWLRRWGTKEVLVNTQEGNEPAVRLYEALGFRLQPSGLAVLRRVLDAS